MRDAAARADADATAAQSRLEKVRQELSALEDEREKLRANLQSLHDPQQTAEPQLQTRGDALDRTLKTNDRSSSDPALLPGSESAPAKSMPPDHAN